LLPVLNGELPAAFTFPSIGVLGTDIIVRPPRTILNSTFSNAFRETFHDISNQNGVGGAAISSNLNLFNLLPGILGVATAVLGIRNAKTGGAERRQQRRIEPGEGQYFPEIQRPLPPFVEPIQQENPFNQRPPQNIYPPIRRARLLSLPAPPASPAPTAPPAPGPFAPGPFAPGPTAPPLPFAPALPPFEAAAPLFNSSYFAEKNLGRRPPFFPPRGALPFQERNNTTSNFGRPQPAFEEPVPLRNPQQPYSPSLHPP
jgi:hypothetical protein